MKHVRISLHVIEVRELPGRDSAALCDPFVRVTVAGKERKQTSIRYGNTSTAFDEQFSFPDVVLSGAEYEKANIRVEVFDAKVFFRNELIGQCLFGIKSLRSLPKHEIFQQWVALEHPDRANSGQGFIKLSIAVLGEDDRPTGHLLRRNDATLKELQLTAPVSAVGQVLSNPMLVEKRRGYNFKIQAFKAEHLASEGNTFLAIRFNGVVSTTPIKAKSRNPEWNYELVMPVFTPRYSDVVEIELWTTGGASETLVASLTFRFSDLLSKLYPPSWINFYGPSSEETGFSAWFSEMMSKKRLESTTYLGRALVSFTTALTDNPQADQKLCEPVSGPEVEKYVLWLDVLKGMEIPVPTFGDVMVQVEFGPSENTVRTNWCKIGPEITCEFEEVSGDRKPGVAQSVKFTCDDMMRMGDEDSLSMATRKRRAMMSRKESSKPDEPAAATSAASELPFKFAQFRPIQVVLPLIELGEKDERKTSQLWDIVVSVYVRDALNRVSRIGFVKIHPTNIWGFDNDPEWFPLKGMVQNETGFSESQGFIMLAAKFGPMSLAKQFLETKDRQDYGRLLLPSKRSAYEVRAYVYQARNLPTLSDASTGALSSWVEMSVGGHLAERQYTHWSRKEDLSAPIKIGHPSLKRTSVARDTLSPIFYDTLVIRKIWVPEMITGVTFSDDPNSKNAAAASGQPIRAKPKLSLALAPDIEIVLRAEGQKGYVGRIRFPAELASRKFWPKRARPRWLRFVKHDATVARLSEHKVPVSGSGGVGGAGMNKSTAGVVKVPEGDYYGGELLVKLEIVPIEYAGKHPWYNRHRWPKLTHAKLTLATVGLRDLLTNVTLGKLKGNDDDSAVLKDDLDDLVAVEIKVPLFPDMRRLVKNAYNKWDERKVRSGSVRGEPSGSARLLVDAATSAGGSSAGKESSGSHDDDEGAASGSDSESEDDEDEIIGMGRASRRDTEITLGEDSDEEVISELERSPPAPAVAAVMTAVEGGPTKPTAVPKLSAFEVLVLKRDNVETEIRKAVENPSVHFEDVVTYLIPLKDVVVALAKTIPSSARDLERDGENDDYNPANDILYQRLTGERAFSFYHVVNMDINFPVDGFYAPSMTIRVLTKNSGWMSNAASPAAVFGTAVVPLRQYSPCDEGALLDKLVDRTFQLPQVSLSQTGKDAFEAMLRRDSDYTNSTMGFSVAGGQNDLVADQQLIEDMFNDPSLIGEAGEREQSSATVLADEDENVGGGGGVGLIGDRAVADDDVLLPPSGYEPNHEPTLSVVIDPEALNTQFETELNTNNRATLLPPDDPLLKTAAAAASSGNKRSEKRKRNNEDDDGGDDNVDAAQGGGGAPDEENEGDDNLDFDDAQKKEAVVQAKMEEFTGIHWPVSGRPRALGDNSVDSTLEEDPFAIKPLPFDRFVLTRGSRVDNTEVSVGVFKAVVKIDVIDDADFGQDVVELRGGGQIKDLGEDGGRPPAAISGEGHRQYLAVSQTPHEIPASEILDLNAVDNMTLYMNGARPFVEHEISKDRTAADDDSNGGPEEDSAAAGAVFPIYRLVDRGALRVKVRVYIVQAVDLWSRTPDTCKPFLRLQMNVPKRAQSTFEGFTSKHFGDHDAKKGTSAFFGTMYELDARFPDVTELQIRAYDGQSTFGGPELIGSTKIDLEDRWFNPKWQMMKAKKRFLREFRPLTVKSSGVARGTVEMWIEMYEPFEAVEAKVTDIRAPKPDVWELRIVIWETRNVPPPEDQNHISQYVTTELSYRGDDGIWRPDQYKSTDTHWWVDNGVGLFNWRNKFVLEVPCRFPRLTFKVWQTELITMTPDSVAGQATVDIDFLANIAQAWESDDPYERPRMLVKLTQDRGSASRGEVEIQISMLRQKIAEERPVGSAREPPNLDPFLAEPKREKFWSALMGGGSSWFRIFCICTIVLIFVALILVIVLLALKPAPASGTPAPTPARLRFLQIQATVAPTPHV